MSTYIHTYIHIITFTFIINNSVNIGLGLGLWYLTLLSALFQLYHGGQSYLWRKPAYPVKTVHIKLYRLHLAMGGIRTQNVSSERQ